MLKRSSTPLLLFAAGMAAGWVAKHLFDTPQVQKQTQKLMVTAEELRDRLRDSDEAERVKEVFGKVTQEATNMYQEARESLVDELESLQVSFEDLDKQKYLEIVGDIIGGLQKDRALPEDQVRKLTRALNSDWQKISQEMSSRRGGTKRLASKNKEQ